MSEDLEVSGVGEGGLEECLIRGSQAADAVYAIFVFSCLKVPGSMKRAEMEE